MSRDFAITTVDRQIKLQQGTSGTVAHTVTNTTGGEVTARARIVTMDGSDDTWFAITGEQERVFAGNATQQYSVTVNIPPTAIPGTYRFRLDVFSVENPDENFAEGPAVEISVEEKAETETPKGDGFPWWIAAVVATVLIIGGGIIYFVVNSNDTENDDNGGYVISDATEIPEILGETYEKAFELLNKKGFKYQVYTNSIDRRDTSRMTGPSLSAGRPAGGTARFGSSEPNVGIAPPVLYTITLKSMLPVVDSLYPAQGTEMSPKTSVVQVYFGNAEDNTEGPYVELDKSFFERKTNISKSLIININK